MERNGARFELGSSPGGAAYSIRDSGDGSDEVLMKAKRKLRRPGGPVPILAGWGILLFPVLVMVGAAVVRFPLHVLVIVGLGLIAWVGGLLLEWLLGFFIS